MLARRLARDLERREGRSRGEITPRRRSQLFKAAAALALGIAGAANPGAAYAAVTSNVAGGVLTVSSNAGDAITITCSAGNVKVNAADPGSGAAACNTITAMNVTGGSTPNNINLNAVTAGVFTALTGTSLNGSGGADTITGSQVADQVTAGELEGFDTTNGAGGVDTFVLGATTFANVSGTIAATVVSGNNDHNLSNFEGVRLNGTNGEDGFGCASSPIPCTLLAGAAGDNFVGSPFNDSYDGGASGIGTLIDRYIIQPVDLATDPATLTVTNTQVNGAGQGVDTLTSVDGVSVQTTFDKPNTWSALTSSAVSVLFDAGPGNDALTGSTLADSIVGGDGDDSIVPGNANDTVVGGLGSDTYTEDNLTSATTPSATTFNFGATFGTDTVTEVERMNLDGTAASESINLTNSQIPTQIDLEGSNDTVVGGTQPDTLTGGGGDDSANGGGGIDLFRGIGAAGVVNLTDTSLTGYGLDALQAIETASLTGSAGSDTLDASAFGGTVSLLGAGGDDVVLGALNTVPGAGSGDSLDGGTGAADEIRQTANANQTLTDSALTGIGSDGLAGFELANLTIGDNVGRLLDATGFTGSVTLTGGAGPDSLRGGSGADSLLGLDGADSLDGGLGVDVFSAGAGADFLKTDDGVAETSIACGDDADTYTADATDTPGGDCEAPAPPPDGGGGGGGGTGGDGGGTPPPGTEPPPAGGAVVDSTAPVMGLSGGRVSRRGVVTVFITCPSGEKTCVGSFTLRTVKAPGVRRQTLGRGGFAATGGQRVAKRVKLKRAALALLRRRGRLATRLSTVTVDAAGNRASASRRLRLRAPRRR